MPSVIVTGCRLWAILARLSVNLQPRWIKAEPELKVYAGYGIKKAPLVRAGLLNRVNSYNEMSSTWNLIVPAGACTSATSPTTLPSRPFPIGEVLEIFPAFRSASFSLTIW